MKIGFYPKLAFDGIRKNKRLYIPFILTCTGMVMMYYIISFLRDTETLSYLRGAEQLRMILDFGSWVIAIFACVFLFYTNSFLIRRRKKEFGLYNILGMGKRNIGAIILWEMVITAGVSLVIGLAFGFLFSKIAELGLVNIMGGEIHYTLSFSLHSILMTAAVFCVIFFLMFLNALRQVRFSSAISLLRSENAGEKPPKGNWFLALLGVLLLSTAYTIAVLLKDPIAALVYFFIAVILVIIGTYLLMISGSVIFCRILQKKKGYYYKPEHFVSVSSMVYRMKRNGAGLASICILATMVLVSISSTASLYFGNEDILSTRYPREINLSFRMESVEGVSDENIQKLRQEVLNISESCGVVPTNLYDMRIAQGYGVINGTEILTNRSDVEKLSQNSNSAERKISFVPISDYNVVMNANESLGDDEVLLYTNRCEYRNDSILLPNGKRYRIKKMVDDFVPDGEAASMSLPVMVFFVPDLETAVQDFNTQTEAEGGKLQVLNWIINFDTEKSEDVQTHVFERLGVHFREDVQKETFGYHRITIECKELERQHSFGLFGGLFYLGIMLSCVFLFAAVLIIYYKQISEGYEDQARFDIMQKVGMTKKEIRKSINSQLLTVFFLPLITAGVHLCFAFPMIRKLLLMFNLNNIRLFAVTTGISFLIFALFYTLVYKITSNAYYNIVSGAKQKARE